MTPEPFTETPENERIVLRLFRAGENSLDIARRYKVGEPQILRMLDRARTAERAENAGWQSGARS